jgi:hypothetical protein
VVPASIFQASITTSAGNWSDKMASSSFATTVGLSLGLLALEAVATAISLLGLFAAIMIVVWLRSVCEVNLAAPEMCVYILRLLYLVLSSVA